MELGYMANIVLKLIIHGLQLMEFFSSTLIIV